MSVVPPLLVWLALAAAVEPADGDGSGFRPTGSLDELVDLGLLARLRDPRVRPLAIEAGPRRPGTGGGVVLAEIAGPGVVQRIEWIGPGGYRTDPDPAQDRLKIYLDGGEQPALEMSRADLAAGRHPHFPRPLAGRVAGGVYSDVPIAFRAGCRIVADGPAAATWTARVSGVALPDASGITPFRERLSPEGRAQLERAVATWSRPEDPAAPERMSVETCEYNVDGVARSIHRFLLPAGPRTIRALEIEAEPGTGDAWRAARLRLTWEHQGRAPGVDLPVGLAFATLPGVAPCQTLLMGQTGSSWTNRFPMPYRDQAFLQIDSETAIRGRIRVRGVRGVAADAAYFRATYREFGGAGARPAVAFEGVELSGRGHYAGTLIAVPGAAGVVTRPGEVGRSIGDVRWVIAGLGTELAIDWSPSRPVPCDPAPTHGILLGRGDATVPPAAAYRWHAADPIPFARPLRAAIELDPRAAPADVRALVAVFWYSESPGPLNGGP
jgi:hypothetical protein